MNRSFNNKTQSFNNKAQSLRLSDLDAVEVKSKVSTQLCLLFLPSTTLICVFGLSLQITSAAVFTLDRSGSAPAL